MGGALVASHKILKKNKHQMHKNVNNFHNYSEQTISIPSEGMNRIKRKNQYLLINKKSNNLGNKN